MECNATSRKSQTRSKVSVGVSDPRDGGGPYPSWWPAAASRFRNKTGRRGTSGWGWPVSRLSVELRQHDACRPCRTHPPADRRRVLALTPWQTPRAPSSRSCGAARPAPARGYSVASSGLKERLKELIPPMNDKIKKIKAEHGEKILGTCTVAQVSSRSAGDAWLRDAHSPR